MLVDSAVILVRSGKGGDGKVSFRREKYINKGGPDGGDGGRGGDVILVATAGVDTLLDFAGRHHWEAASGEDGGRKQCAGRDAEDLRIRVPLGTLVFDQGTGELLGDLDQPGKEMLIAKGGRGGWGNEHFKSATHQTPYNATPGQAAQERTLRLELKVLADVGVIGKPNAGKSTLLSRISRAHPKFADIPGLIEGAHAGHGLGTRFLRHIERTRLLVHLLEVEPSDGTDAVGNYRVVREELRRYSQTLAAKPEIVVLSKMDLLPGDDDHAAACQLLEQELGITVLPISAANGDGLNDLLEQCWRLLRTAPAPVLATDAHPADRPAAAPPTDPDSPPSA